MRRLLVPGVAVALLSLSVVAAPAADAATTLGSTTGASTDLGPDTWLQVASPGTAYSVPPGSWVLLRMSARLSTTGADPFAAGVVARPTRSPVTTRSSGCCPSTSSRTRP